MRQLRVEVKRRQNRGVRWQTDCLPKRIRGLLRATKRFFSNKQQDEIHELLSLEFGTPNLTIKCLAQRMRIDQPNRSPIRFNGIFPEITLAKRRPRLRRDQRRFRRLYGKPAGISA